jgi:hypothetical protein
MSSEFHKTLTISAASTTAVAALQTLGGAGDLTLASSTVTLPNQGQRPSLTSANNLSAVTFTFYGTDVNGKTFSLAMAGPNANTVILSVAMATITRIAANAAAAAVSAGYAAQGETAMWPVDRRLAPVNIGLGITQVSTTYTLQHTFEDIYASTFDPGTAVWFNHPSLTALAAAADGNYSMPIAAFRLYGTGAGSARLDGYQGVGLAG